MYGSSLTIVTVSESEAVAPSSSVTVTVAVNVPFVAYGWLPLALRWSCRRRSPTRTRRSGRRDPTRSGRRRGSDWTRPTSRLDRRPRSAAGCRRRPRRCRCLRRLTVGVGDGQRDGVRAGCRVGVLRRGAGAGRAVAERPRVAGDAHFVGAPRCVELHGERRRAAAGVRVKRATGGAVARSVTVVVAAVAGVVGDGQRDVDGSRPPRAWSRTTGPFNVEPSGNVQT